MLDTVVYWCKDAEAGLLVYYMGKWEQDMSPPNLRLVLVKYLILPESEPSDIWLFNEG